MKIPRTLALMLLASLATGCLSVKAGTNETTSYASYVGPMDTIAMPPVRVSVPGGSPLTFHNLHVETTALIERREPSLKSEYQVTGIVRRCGPAVASAILQAAIASPPTSANDFGAKRAQLEAAANAEFNRHYRAWTHADEYDVRIVITSLYFEAAPAAQDRLETFAPPRG